MKVASQTRPPVQPVIVFGTHLRQFPATQCVVSPRPVQAASPLHAPHIPVLRHWGVASGHCESWLHPHWKVLPLLRHTGLAPVQPTVHAVQLVASCATHAPLQHSWLLLQPALPAVRQRTHM